MVSHSRMGLWKIPEGARKTLIASDLVIFQKDGRVSSRSFPYSGGAIRSDSPLSGRIVARTRNAAARPVTDAVDGTAVGEHG